MNNMNEDKRYYIYGYIRLDTNKYFYIGKGTRKRAYAVTVSRNAHFKNIIDKYETRMDILYDHLSEQEAYDKEKETIRHLVEDEGYSISIKGIVRNPEAHLVNKSWGGEGAYGYSQSEKAKEAIRQYHLNKKVSEQTRKKLSKLNSGKNHPNYGKNLSQKTKEKISIANKGRIRTQEWLDNLSKSHLGQISEKRLPVYCPELKMKFSSISEATAYTNKNFGFKRLKISETCRGLRNYSGKLSDKTKLHWKYIDTPATTEYRDGTNNDSEATV